MLYVALSRVGSSECLTMLVWEKCKTRSVIYNESFNYVVILIHCLSADLRMRDIEAWVCGKDYNVYACMLFPFL